METYLEKLILSYPLRAPVMRQAIEGLDFPAGSLGLDAGCGDGSLTLLLAEAVGTDGHVTGLDLSHDFVAYAGEQAERSHLALRVSIQQGNVNGMPFEDNAFDWAWSVDCVGHPTVGEPATALREMARVVRPNGQVAILAYSSQMLLPGHPILEARLNATASAMTCLARGAEPASHFQRALGWFRQAGLVDPTAHTLIGTVQAPLDDGIRRSLLSLMGMLWGEMESKMAKADRAKYRRLTDPKSDECILDCPDYYAYFTYSIFTGRVGEDGQG
jgi:demethylmenaquinone methyltransferase/2-methoxy-6-polyprenyl-1,4-benzoquinol methylase